MMYQLITDFLLVIAGSVSTLLIQWIIRYANRPILQASIVCGSDSNEVGRVLRIKNKGKTTMEGLFVEVILGFDDYVCGDIKKTGSINPNSFMDVHIGI